jgi:hypothetical protein
LIEWYAVDDHPERPAGLAHGNTGWHRGRLSKHKTIAPPECLAVDLAALIDVEDLKRSEKAMKRSTRASLTSEVGSVYVLLQALRP